MNIRTYIYIFLIALPFSDLYSQNLTGFILDKQGKKELPIEGVTIFWLGTSTGTFSDSLGYFSLPIEENKPLVFHLPGFFSDTLNTFTNPLKHFLKPKELKTIEIEGKAPNTTLNTKNVFSGMTLQKGELKKAACCNLSESFETTPSVDVNYADAVTGRKTIQLLGLSGPYTQILMDNIPTMRGILGADGLNLIPGTWVRSIQVIKGPGTVVNGFESMAGQMNISMEVPDSQQILFVNGYINESSRSELNFHKPFKVGKIRALALGHGSGTFVQTDHNHDGFMDNPIGSQWNGMLKWEADMKNGWEGQWGIRFVRDQKYAGQAKIGSHENHLTVPVWNMNLQMNRAEAWSKTGWVNNTGTKSIGIQAFGTRQEIQSRWWHRAYQALQYSGYLNLIYQTEIIDTRHTLKTGASYIFDHLIENPEQIYNTTRKITEQVPGIFAEYTWIPNPKITAVAGIRGDYHNRFGFFATPRVHFRYAPTEKTIFRINAGRGQKSPSAILADQLSLLASNRTFYIPNTEDSFLGFKPEVSWNMGFSFTKMFYLAGKEGSITMDMYHTLFENQIVVDRETPGILRLYNLQGKSYANNAQIQIEYEPIRRFDIRAAYRWSDVWTTYTSATGKNSLLQTPFISPHRAFLNLSYKTRNKWIFDVTGQILSQRRLTEAGTIAGKAEEGLKSPTYFLLFGQITKQFKKGWDIYLGVENATNYRQTHAVVSADDVSHPYFDATRVWGPVFGRMMYVGFRWDLRKPTN